METPRSSPELPPSSTIPLETPRKTRQSSGPSYRSGTLSDAREAVILDVDSIPEVSFEFFVLSVLPSPMATSTVDLKKIKDALEADGAIIGGRWSAFPTDPSGHKDQEDVVFSSLVDVNKQIIKAADLDQPTTCIFSQTLHKAPRSNRVNKTRPDGCRIFGQSNETKSVPTSHCGGGHVRWEDMVEVEEYKKRTSFDDVRDVSFDTPPPKPMIKRWST
jgi:hypothetical protein